MLFHQLIRNQYPQHLAQCLVHIDHLLLVEEWLCQSGVLICQIWKLTLANLNMKEIYYIVSIIIESSPEQSRKLGLAFSQWEMVSGTTPPILILWRHTATPANIHTSTCVSGTNNAGYPVWLETLLLEIRCSYSTSATFPKQMRLCFCMSWALM